MTDAPQGAVVSVRGSVVDIRIDEHLPPIYSVLNAGDKGEIVIEVLAQRDARPVRGIALTPTQGLARGFDNAIDQELALADVQGRSVRRAPPPLARRSTKSEIFDTGIKVIDVLGALGRSGKAGLFGGASVGHAALTLAESRQRQVKSPDLESS